MLEQGGFAIDKRKKSWYNIRNFHTYRQLLNRENVVWAVD